jgi:hypothetical protein
MAKGFLFRGGFKPQAFNLTGIIDDSNWVASDVSGAVQNDVVFGTTGVMETSVNYPVTFQDGITSNDFANLPPQIFTWSSNSTTEPITITKEQGQGEFTGKFKGAQIRVFIPQTPSVIYVVTEVVDQNTLTAYYQVGPSQGSVIPSLTQQFGGQNNNMVIIFTDLNGTPDPNIQYLRKGNFVEQLNIAVSSPGFFVGGSINRYFDIPTNAINIVGLNELPDVPNVVDSRGIRAYALIFDNKDAFISTSQGVRKIAKIENGNTFINNAANYGDEDFQQAGGSLQFITPFAMETVAANRATNTDWANAVPIDISQYQEVTIAFALDTFEDDQDAATLGAQLVYETTVATGNNFNENDFLVIELNIDGTTIDDATAIEADWAKVKFYEVIDTNTVRFFADTDGEIDVPVVAKVIK